MKLVRLNGRTVNLSLVQVYTDTGPERIELEFNAGNVLAVDGAEAVALRAFLKSRSISLAPDAEPGPGGFVADDSDDCPGGPPNILPQSDRADEGA